MSVFEMAYVLVYAVIPAAVATLAIGGHPDAIPRFWTVVLLAEFRSYGMMPWLQTRPPRALEVTAGRASPPSALRRFNAEILERGSIQANTVPSGHAAGAVATALAVVDVMPFCGLHFPGAAAASWPPQCSGRYHYLVDSLLGARRRRRRAGISVASSDALYGIAAGRPTFSIATRRRARPPGGARSDRRARARAGRSRVPSAVAALATRILSDRFTASAIERS